MARSRWPERVGDVLTSWVAHLPPRARRLLPPELVGFGIIGAFTFSLDLALLFVLRHHTRLPVPVAVSISYLTAFSLNFVLNRTANFRSHAPVDRQVARYAVVLAVDYLLTVGATTGLVDLGFRFPVARVAASAFVAVFTYSASRWWVFAGSTATRPAVEPADA